MIFIISGLVIAFSAMVQGMAGFGFSLVAVPLLSQVMPLSVVVPMLVVYSIFLNILVVTKVRGPVDKNQLGLLIGFGVIAIPVGIFALKFLDETWLKRGVGILVTTAAVAMYFDYKLPIRRKKMAYAITGLVSGFLNGATSLSGPPVILMLSNEGTEKARFRKSLAVFFLALNCVTVPMFLASGVLSSAVIKEVLKTAPFMLVGTLVGISLGNRMPEALFRKLTLGLIVLMGILTLR